MSKLLGYKWCSLIISLLIIVMTMPDIFAYKWGEIPQSPTQDIIVYENTGSADNLTGTFGVIEDGKDGAGLSIGKKNYITQLIKKFPVHEYGDKAFFRQGRALISFDIKAKQSDHCIVFAINDSQKNSYAAFAMNGMGMMYYNKSTSWPSATNTPEWAVPYEVNRWYNIKILIDSHNRRIIFYKDDVFWGEYLLTKSGLFNTEIYPDITIMQMFFNYHADMTIKEGKVVKSDGSGEFIIDNLTYSLPAFEDYDIECTLDGVGNIVQGKQAKLNYIMGNNTEKDKQLTLKYEIVRADNKCVAKGETGVQIKAKSNTEVQILAEVDEYGFYIARAYVYENNELKNTLETRFSCIVKNEKQNPRTGFSTNVITHARGSIEETVAVTKALGGSLLRDDYPMWQIYQEDGVTEKAYYQPFVNYPTMAKENGISTIAVMSPGPDTMGGVSWPPTLETIQTTNVLDIWSNFTKRLVKSLDGICDEFEVYNEWPGQATNKTKATPAAYAEFLKATHKAIKEANPNAKVIAFCCFYNDAQWMDGVLEALGENPGQYFDIVSIHPYLNYWINVQYPEGDYINGMENVMSVLKKYGVDDKPIYATEYGFSTEFTVYGVKTIDEKRKSDYSTRMMLLSEKYFDKSWLYTVTKKVGMNVAYEAGIGHTASSYETEIAYEALPSAVSFAAFNKIMGGSTFMWNKMYPMTEGVEADDIYVTKHKLSDEDECLAIWRVGGEQTMSINFGCDYVKVYDSYGNERELYAVDGYITMKVGEEPMYIVADKVGEPLFKEQSIFDMQYKANTLIDSEYEIMYTDNSKSETEADISVSDNMKIENVYKNNERTSIKVSTGNNRGDFQNYSFKDGKAPEKLCVKLIKNGRVVFDEYADVFYDDTMDINLEIVPYRSGRWQAVLSIRNNNPKKSVDGNIELTLGNGETLEISKIGALSPGQKRIKRINIPQSLTTSSIEISADIITDNGAKIRRNATSEFATFIKTEKKPEIDGIMQSGEWNVYTSPITLNDVEIAKRYAGWEGISDLSGEIYAMYDDKNFYMAAKVRDDIHFGNDSQGRLWAQDCIQLSFSPGNEATSPITEFAVSLCEGDETKIQRYLSAVSSDADYDINDLGDIKAVTKRLNDTTVVYEMVIPWCEIFPEEYKMGESVNFSLLIADNDGIDREGWLEFGRGIGDSKDASRFKNITLVK